MQPTLISTVTKPNYDSPVIPGGKVVNNAHIHPSWVGLFKCNYYGICLGRMFHSIVIQVFHDATPFLIRDI